MCDTICVTKEKTRNGFTIFGKASDRAVNEPQSLIFIPAADHEPGSKVRCTYIEVDQAPHTCAVILSKPSWIWGGEIGMNEYGVCIGNEAVFSRELVTDREALLGMDVLRLALERSKTAEEAAKVIAELMERYGQGGNASFDGKLLYDNSYLAADAQETWQVEAFGSHYWAAAKVSGVCSISNYMSMSYPKRMHSGVIENAEKKGYPVETPFDLAAAYADWKSPLNASGMQRRCCSLQMASRSGSDFTVSDMFKVLRSHFTVDPWTRGGNCVCMHAQNPEKKEDVPCQTCGAMAAELKGRDTLMWGTGMGVTCIAPFQPMWFDAFSRKQVFPYENMEEGMDAWLRREGINRAVLDGRIPVEEYQRELYAMEHRWMERADQAAGASREIRQALCDDIAGEAETFMQGWLNQAAVASAAPLGTKEFQAWWRQKNAELGKDRRLAR